MHLQHKPYSHFCSILLTVLYTIHFHFHFCTYHQASGAPLSKNFDQPARVVKNGTKKTFEGFLNVLNVLNMSHGNGSSAFVFQVTGILKPVTDSTDKMLQLSHSNMVSVGARTRMAVGHPNVLVKVKVNICFG